MASDTMLSTVVGTARSDCCLTVDMFIQGRLIAQRKNHQI
jgi:hypothetical protein